MCGTPKSFLTLTKETAAEWSSDNASRLGAALAYYTVFAIAPLLLIVVTIVGFIWGDQSMQVQQEVLGQISAQMGEDAADVIRNLLESMAEERSGGGRVAAVVGVLTLLFAATGVFVQLQGALNTIWDVKPKPGQGIMGFVMSRLLSFGLILVIGFLLLVSLVASTVLSILSAKVQSVLPGVGWLWSVLEFGISFGLITLLFAFIYYYLPDVEVAWRDVWVGAAVTALLFVVGEYLLSLYLGRSSTASTYGAAGSFVALLVWIYYSAQIFFFGAEFTQVYARFEGRQIQPSQHAVHIYDDPEEIERLNRRIRGIEGQTSAAVPVVQRVRAPARPSRKHQALLLMAAFWIGHFFGRRGS